MSEGRIYTATAERDGRFWYLAVEELDAATQARRLDQAEEMVRDLISIKLGVAPDTFDVIVIPKLDEWINEIVTGAMTAKVKARHAQETASDLLRLAAIALTNGGLTTRDAAGILGLSHQRIAQVLEMPDLERRRMADVLDRRHIDAPAIVYEPGKKTEIRP